MPFDWQSGKEIICITGGSSGFGALMVEEFVEKTKAKIVVIDVQDLPKNLTTCEFSPLLAYLCPAEILMLTGTVKCQTCISTSVT